MVRVRKEKESESFFDDFFTRFKRKKQKLSPKVSSKIVKVREVDGFNIIQKSLIIFVVIVSFFILVLAGGYLFNLIKRKNVQGISVCGIIHFMKHAL